MGIIFGGSKRIQGGNVFKTPTAEKNNYRCPACGDELHGDPSGRGFVRHVSNPSCLFEKGEKDAPGTVGKAAQQSRPSGDPTTSIKAHLRKWADSNRIPIDQAGYTLELRDNLFVDLSDAARAEFAAGDGGELGSPTARGKMQALHSSSAMACNFFEYWRGRDCASLAIALGVQDEVTRIQFERKFPTGLPGNAPNMDVVLTTTEGPIVAIESKFLEPYGRRHEPGFKTKYFERSPGCWARHGLTHCQKVAERLDSGDLVFRWLHAEQLLKHILGLASSGAQWELLYLWYQPPGAVGTQHAAEADAFAETVNQDAIRFRSMTYQELLAGLTDTASVEGDYLAYLRSRYFSEEGDSV